MTDPTVDAERRAAESVLDREGEWEIRVTVYRNKRKVATCDTVTDGTYDQAAYWVSEGLNTRDLVMHTRKKRGSHDGR